MTHPTQQACMQSYSYTTVIGIIHILSGTSFMQMFYVIIALLKSKDTVHDLREAYIIVYQYCRHRMIDIIRIY